MTACGVALAVFVGLLGACHSPSEAHPADSIFVADDGRTMLFAGVGRRPFDVTHHTLPLGSIITGGPEIDDIPALGLSAPPIFESAETAAEWLVPEDGVVGVRLDGAAKAYPIRLLNWHEVVNDTLAGPEGPLPIVVVWSPLAASAAVFSREIEGEPMLWGVTGKSHDGVSLLYDRASYSLWHPLRRSAVVGPRAGTPWLMLPMPDRPRWAELVVRLTSFAAWRAQAPGTLILASGGQRYPNDWMPRDYSRDPYAATVLVTEEGEILEKGDYRDPATPLMFTPSVRDTLRRLLPKARIFGLDFGLGAVKAYPLDALPVGQAVMDTLAGHAVKVHRADSLNAYALDAAGRQLPGVTAFWFAWYAAKPHTALWSPKAARPAPER